MSKEKWDILFSECEHEGDLEHYASEISKCGINVVGQRLDPYEYETGIISVVVPVDSTFKEEFGMKIGQSDIAGFIEGREFICNIDSN